MACSINLTESVGLSLLPNLRHAPLEEVTLKPAQDQRIMMNVALCDIWYVYI